jgi:Uma2 family endonuclease
MIAQNVPITPEQLLSLPDNESLEIVRGQIVEKKVGAESKEIEAVIVTLLSNYCRANRLGRVYSGEVPLRCFTHDPTMLRKADAAFLSYGRWPADRKVGSFITVPPDLAVEVVSPNDVFKEVQDKLTDYLKAEIPLIWIVNEFRRTVEVHSAHGPKILGLGDELTGENVIPGFRCQVSEIFACIPTEE